MRNACQYAAPGTYGHECGRPADSVVVVVMRESTKQALRNMGATVPADGLSRARRCPDHRGITEMGDGPALRTESL